MLLPQPALFPSFTSSLHSFPPIPPVLEVMLNFPRAVFLFVRVNGWDLFLRCSVRVRGRVRQVP